MDVYRANVQLECRKSTEYCSYLEQLNANYSEQKLEQQSDNHDISNAFDGKKHTLNNML